MSGSHDEEESDERDGEEGQGQRRSLLAPATLSDLSVNAIPIGIVGAFVVLFALFSPGSLDAEPLLGAHAALVGGIGLVSYVAVRAVLAADGELGEREVSLYGEKPEEWAWVRVQSPLRRPHSCRPPGRG
jgi:hypothetical protein